MYSASLYMLNGLMEIYCRNRYAMSKVSVMVQHWIANGRVGIDDPELLYLMI